MGTLFNQLPRKKHRVEIQDLMAAADDIKTVAEESGLKTETVAEIYKAEALNRFTECYIENGDVKDEQLMGIGEILEEIAGSIRAVAEAVNTKPEGELP